MPFKTMEILKDKETRRVAAGFISLAQWKEQWLRVEEKHLIDIVKLAREM